MVEQIDDQNNSVEQFGFDTMIKKTDGSAD